jgi:hypothetical protein
MWNFVEFCGTLFRFCGLLWNLWNHFVECGILWRRFGICGICGLLWNLWTFVEFVDFCGIVEMKTFKLDYFTKKTKIYIFQKILLKYNSVTYSFGGTSAKYRSSIPGDQQNPLMWKSPKNNGCS